MASATPSQDYHAVDLDDGFGANTNKITTNLLVDSGQSQDFNFIDSRVAAASGKRVVTFTLTYNDYDVALLTLSQLVKVIVSVKVLIVIYVYCYF